MTSRPACPFCDVPPESIVDDSWHALALRDNYPVAPGHTLVVPRRHVTSVFELSPQEWEDVWRLVRRLRSRIEELRVAEGITVGVNDGFAAGQTVEHAHVHLIPRNFGDVPDPRGGVRRLIPHRADYWSARLPDEKG